MRLSMLRRAARARAACSLATSRSTLRNKLLVNRKIMLAFCWQHVALHVPGYQRRPCCTSLHTFTPEDTAGPL